MKVYDCFTFYNEFELLELRLKSLWDMVDCFVIVEADKTHTNKPKPFYFWERQDEFKEFFPKIRHLPVEMNVPYNGVGDWSIENAQREAIIYGLDDAEPDDLIFISDADEFPAPDVISRINSNEAELVIDLTTVPPITQTKTKCPAKILVSAAEYLDNGAVVLEQNMHCYYFDWTTDDCWAGTALIKRKNLTSPQQVRGLLGYFPRLLKGGYHLSYMGGAERVLEKMTSIVDGNTMVVQTDGLLLNKRYVEHVMANGIDLYGRQGLPTSQLVPCDARNINLPHLDEFLTKYPHFLREPEKFFAN